MLALLKITGDWQKFKGLPGAEGTLKVKEPKPSKLELFNAALAEAESGTGAAAVTPKKKKAPKKDQQDEAAEAEAPAAEAAADEAASES
ncbi:30S ribosomal protein S16 [Mycolicibacterium fortuitum]|uniref:30S ribosomal protein S16 n=1 Tax=Mycolicibacterium fortuitum TaxID=1766 RepID=A0A378U9N4_MYCFO|nr:30S ribosomal protein S16 [Mycolicibacterium fortuitum]